MKNKNIILFGIVIFLIVLLAGLTSAICCEKTIVRDDGTGGIPCADVIDEAVCDDNLRVSQTGCQATGYCKTGTCVNDQQGTCLPSSQSVCNNEGGSWYAEDKTELTQCQLGCCLLGEQAAFVTQTRCSYLASTKSLEPNFRADIRNEGECIALATPHVKGACVFETERGRSCSFITKRECQERGDGFRFHPGFLCSATDLGTICKKTENTQCDSGGDVRFVDSCGNLANIYDSTKKNDQNYWTYVKEWSESCNPASANKDSKTCGNCNYELGSTCGVYRRGEDSMPNAGNYLCRDLDCKVDTNGDGTKEKYNHGDIFCAQRDDWTGAYAPGREHVKLICYNGEVSAELCSNQARAKICIDSITTVEYGAITHTRKDSYCEVNRWQDCSAQDNEKDCINADKRDCNWLEGASILKDGDGNDRELRNEEDEDVKASCVPLYSPGFDFWNAEGEAEQQCSLASSYCVVEYEQTNWREWKGKDPKVTKGKNCLPKGESGSDGSWAGEEANLCLTLGDCGVKVNYYGEEGYRDWKEFFVGETYDEYEGSWDWLENLLK